MGLRPQPSLHKHSKRKVIKRQLLFQQCTLSTGGIDPAPVLALTLCTPPPIPRQTLACRPLKQRFLLVVLRFSQGSGLICYQYNSFEFCFYIFREATFVGRQPLASGSFRTLLFQLISLGGGTQSPAPLKDFQCEASQK